jgi:Tfp pilus assembly protein PilN
MVRRINLLPQNERRRTKADVGMLSLVVIVVAALGGMAFSYFYFTGVAAERESELASVQMQRQQVEAQLAALASFDALQQEVQANENLVQQIFAGRTLVSQVLGDLSLVVPEQVWFDSLEVKAPPLTVASAAAAPASATAAPGAVGADLGSVAIQGVTYSFEDVAQLMVRLDQVSSIGLVNLSTADSNEIGERDVKTFSISTSLSNMQSPATRLPVTEVEVKG